MPESVELKIYLNENNRYKFLFLKYKPTTTTKTHRANVYAEMIIYHEFCGDTSLPLTLITAPS